MISTDQFKAFEFLVKFADSVLEGQMVFGPDEVEEVSGKVTAARRALQVLKHATVDQTTLLDAEEVATMLWMYDKSAEWRGGLMPEDFAEFDGQLKEARAVLEKLGIQRAAHYLDQENAQTAIINDLWQAHAMSQGGTTLMRSEGFDTAVRELIDRLPGLVFPVDPQRAGPRPYETDSTPGTPAPSPHRTVKRGAARARHRPRSPRSAK